MSDSVYKSFLDVLLSPEVDIHAHVRFFRDVAKGNILEIGTRWGASTCAFLVGLEDAGGHLYSVDIRESRLPFDGHPQLTRILCDAHDADKIKKLIPPVLDILFLDGDHTYTAIRQELQDYAGLVKNGGLILAHDVGGASNEPHTMVDPESMWAIGEFAARTGWKFEVRPKSHGLAVIHVGVPR